MHKHKLSDYPGKFIVVEGGEGSGKTTNVAFIKQLLNDKGIDFIHTREPGGTPLAEQLRELLLAKREEKVSADAELLMIFAARAQHLQECILPALKRGTWVLCDRFTDATFAYQGGGRGMEDKIINMLADFVQKGLWPDLTLLLDVPVEVGRARAEARGELDRFESEQLVFYTAVRNKYFERANAEPSRFAVIDAARSLDLVQADIAQALAAMLA